MGQWKCSCMHLNLGTRLKLVYSFILPPLYPLEEPLSVHLIGGGMNPTASLVMVTKRKILASARN